MGDRVIRLFLRLGIGMLGMGLSVPNAGNAAVATVANSLQANIVANGELSVPGALTLSNTGYFASYTGILTVQYRARTSAAGGGTLTLKVTQDFQSGGPSVSRGDLAYSCSGAGLGTACALTTASTGAATGVVTLPAAACTGGGAPCSGSDPNSVQVTFTLADNPTNKTGTYTANVQFTISAT
jgi:hypothetical protein